MESPATEIDAVDETPAALAATLTEVDSERTAMGLIAQASATAMQTVATFMRMLRDRPRRWPLQGFGNGPAASMDRRTRYWVLVITDEDQGRKRTPE